MRTIHYIGLDTHCVDTEMAVDCADELVVCEPRRNHLIARDSDKDDPIDAEKLAQLYRGGYLKRVHHSKSLDRAIFKQHVVGYHDAVGLRVARANRILSQFRQHGVFLKEADFAERNKREKLLGRVAEFLRCDLPVPLLDEPPPETTVPCDP